MFQELDCCGDELLHLLSLKKGKYHTRIQKELSGFDRNKVMYVHRTSQGSAVTFVTRGG